MAQCFVDREIRTPRPSAPRNFSPRVYLKIASDTLRGEQFDSYADLFDGVKTAISRLHVPYDGPAINQALRELAMRRGPLVRQPRTVPRATTPEPRTIGRSEAATILEGIRKHLPVDVRTWR